MRIRHAIWFVAAAALPMAACTVYDQPGTATTPATTDDYQPLYYEGNPVYYENDQPYVVVQGETQYVPRDRPEYKVFVDHYHRHGVGYRRWVQAHPAPHGRWHHDDDHGDHDHHHHDRD